jgi:hypothetical protein
MGFGIVVLQRSTLYGAPLWPAGHLPHKEGDWQLWPFRLSCKVGDWRKPAHQPISPHVGEMAGRPEGGAKERRPSFPKQATTP